MTSGSSFQGRSTAAVAPVTGLVARQPAACSPAARGSPARLRLAVAALGLVLAAVILPVPAHAAGRAASPASSESSAAARGSFSINLYRAGDFAPQRTPYWCVGASMQMMLNIIGVTDDDSHAGQERYMRLARSAGPSLHIVDHGRSDGTLRGAGSSGWAAAMAGLGAGPYRQWTDRRYTVALHEAAAALRRTGRPVGLIVWRGAHAWVMSGFTATADPLTETGFRVTGVYIQDPWYPRVSSIWGRGRKPNTWLSTSQLSRAFLPRRGGRWHPELAGTYVLVLPEEPATGVRLWRLL